MAATPESTVMERGIIIRRAFDAPRELVWRALIERDHVMRWLGPPGCTVLEFEMNCEPGGAWRSRVRSPTGTDYLNQGIVLEAAEPDRLVFTCALGNDEGSPSLVSLITIVLVECDGETEMTFAQGVLELAEEGSGENDSIPRRVGVAAA